VLELFRANRGHDPEPGSAAAAFLVILYVMAFACFAGALTLLVVGTWGLVRVLLERPTDS
jgi:hypothetical protein